MKKTIEIVPAPQDAPSDMWVTVHVGRIEVDDQGGVHRYPRRTAEVRVTTTAGKAGTVLNPRAVKELMESLSMTLNDWVKRGVK